MKLIADEKPAFRKVDTHGPGLVGDLTTNATLRADTWVLVFAEPGCAGTCPLDIPAGPVDLFQHLRPIRQDV